jgi:aspartyl/glutamyl-tRNA(Asn/Gln) amidotransferase C subunit
MSDIDKKITSLKHALKLEVYNEEKFKNDINKILDMFNQLSNIDLDQESNSQLIKRKITIKDLRTDTPKESILSRKFSGKYFKTPSVK